MKNINQKKIKRFLPVLILLLVFLPSNLQAQKNIPITGKIVDDNDYEIPFAAIGIISKNIGTTSTEDGTFYFQISANELKDTLSISSLGFSTYLLPVSQISLNEKMVIVLKEKRTSLNEVVVNSTSFYVRPNIK